MASAVWSASLCVVVVIFNLSLMVVQSHGRPDSATHVASPQLANVAFKQAPAPAAEPVAPRGIDRGHAGAKRRRVDVVEDHAALRKRRAQGGIEVPLILALGPH